MKKTGFFVLSLIALALIGGCGDAPSSNAGTGAKDTYYWADAGSGKNIIVGIADPSSFAADKAAFAPKTGYWYAIWLASGTVSTSKPISMGTIEVSGDQLSFTPSPDLGFSGAGFKGTLANGELTMESIPGTSLANITLEEGGAFGFDPDDPNGSLPSVPGSGGDGGAAAPPAAFKPGRYITDVAFIERPTATIAYEGFPVDLTGMKVEITYNNGDRETKTSANANEFVVDPPVYELNNGLHTIRYIAEYNYGYDLMSPWTTRDFRAPANDPSQNTFFYSILNSGNELTATVTGDKEYFEGDPSFDFSGVSVKATYANGDKTITPTSVYKTAFTGETAPKDSELKVTIGRKYAVIPIKHKNVHSLSGISIDAEPGFSDQVLFDDPRFFSSYRENHWLSRFSGSNLKLSYKGTTVTKTTSIIKAKSDWRLDFTYPENLTQKSTKIGISYKGDDGRELRTSQTIPVYNKLLSISVEPLYGGFIVLNGEGSLPYDKQQSFLRQVKVSAVYQMGSDKNKTVKRDNILIYPNPIIISGSTVYADVCVDEYLIKGYFITNVSKTDADGILNQANSEAYDKKGKPAKAKFTFTAMEASGSELSITKSAILEVGVTGYTN